MNYNDLQILTNIYNLNMNLGVKNNVKIKG